jgi:hypothetical protein
VIGTLLRQDPAWWAIPKSMPGAVVLALLIRAAPDLNRGLEEFSAGGMPRGVVPIALLLTALGVFWILAANSWSRCSCLHLGLPLPPSTLWLIRVAAILIATSIPLAAATLILALRFGAAGAWIRFDPALLGPAARIGAVLFLVTVLFQIPSPKSHRIAITPEYVAYCILVLVIALFATAVAFPGPAVTAVVFVSAVVVGVFTHRGLPVAYSVVFTADTEPSEEPVTASTVDTESRRVASPDDFVGAEPTPGARWLLHRTVFRELRNDVLSWLLLALSAASATVCVAEFHDGENMVLPLLLISVWLLPLVQLAVARIDRFDPLPISRSLLFAHIAVPILVAILGGAALGKLIALAGPHRMAQVRYQDCRVQVPFEYYEVAPTGFPPMIRAPWGESHTPAAHPVLSDTGPVIYNPYEKGPANSTRFVDWQMRRAVEAVHGIPVPRQLYNADYQPESSFEGGVARGSFTPDYSRGLRSERRSRTAAVALLLLTAASTVALSLVLLQFLPTPSRGYFRWAAGVWVAPIVVVVGGFFVLEIAGLSRMWYALALVSIGVRRLAEALPLPTLALWLLVLLSWIGSYLVARAVFLRVEAPGRKILTPFAEDY